MYSTYGGTEKKRIKGFVFKNKNLAAWSTTFFLSSVELLEGFKINWRWIFYYSFYLYNGNTFIIILFFLVILEELPEELDFGHPFEHPQEKGKKLTNIICICSRYTSEDKRSIDLYTYVSGSTLETKSDPDPTANKTGSVSDLILFCK